jgi:hypothetical protein
MSTDDRNEGHRHDETVVIGAGLQHLEESVRAQLRREAEAVRPHDRLDAILAEAHGSAVSDPETSPGATSGGHRSLLPVAAAALVALAAVGVWVANRPAQTPTPAAPQPTSTSQSATSGTESTATSSPTSSQESGSGPVATQTETVPVYYVGPRSDGSSNLVLFREFGSAQVSAPGDASAKAAAALEQAIAGSPAGAGYRPLWQDVEVDKVEVTGAEIDVALSTGAKGLSANEGRIAVEQLVWTAQAAVGKGNLPVRFTLADGGKTLAGGENTDHTYTRPSDDMAVWAILSPVWIDSPSRGESLPVGKVTVSGVASTNEANVQWEISQGGKSLDSGHTTAEVAAPQRGKYTFTTTALPAGDYTVKVFETSMKDGSVSAAATMPFTLK